jgi:hypothetical protein
MTKKYQYESAAAACMQKPADTHQNGFQCLPFSAAFFYEFEQKRVTLASVALPFMQMKSDDEKSDASVSFGQGWVCGLWKRSKALKYQAHRWKTVPPLPESSTGNGSLKASRYRERHVKSAIRARKFT